MVARLGCMTTRSSGGARQLRRAEIERRIALVRAPGEPLFGPDDPAPEATNQDQRTLKGQETKGKDYQAGWIAGGYETAVRIAIEQGKERPSKAMQEAPADDASSAHEGLSDGCYVHQDSKILDRKLFLRMARAGEFPVSVVGKKRLARLGDVRAALARHQVKVASRSPGLTDDDELDAIRSEVGLLPKKGGP